MTIICAIVVRGLVATVNQDASRLCIASVASENHALL